MATDISTMTSALRRQVNLTGAERLPDVRNSELEGHILDGFWSLRLKGVMSGYTQYDGAELTAPTTGTFIGGATDEGDLPQDYQRLVVMMATFNLMRIVILNLAINFKAEAVVSYEQQASATTLRAILDSLESELEVLQVLLSDQLGMAPFIYMDGVLQSEYAMVNNLAAMTVY